MDKYPDCHICGMTLEGRNVAWFDRNHYYCGYCQQDVQRKATYQLHKTNLFKVKVPYGMRIFDFITGIISVRGCPTICNFSEG